MTKYLMRLDDACEKRNIANWDRMEDLLDKYNIKPLVAVIPNCKDPDFEKYNIDNNFWNVKIKSWQIKGWQIALHGYNHIFHNCDNKINLNPINDFSEFVGLELKEQREKIANGLKKFKEYGINPEVFVAPAHSFDLKTIEALKIESDIRIISDIPAYAPFTKYGMIFIPQQSGCVRKLPFNTVTFCYHPNIMNDSDFAYLEMFFNKNEFNQFKNFNISKSMTLLDKLLAKAYYWRHKK